MDQTNKLLDRTVLAECLEQCDIDPNTTIDDLEIGLVYFLRDTIRSLRKISQKNLTNEQYIKNKFCQNLDTEAEQKMNNSSLVTIVDPLGNYKYAEKRELEMEKYYEDKIQNNREREDKRIEEENQKTQRYLQDQKKPKVYNEDQEIFKMLSKMKIEKNKDQNTEDKYAEGQKNAIEILIKGNEKSNRHNEFQNLRNEIETQQVVKDQIFTTGLFTQLIFQFKNQQMEIFCVKKSQFDQSIFIKKILSPFGTYIDVIQYNQNDLYQFTREQISQKNHKVVQKMLQKVQKIYENTCDFILKPSDHSLYYFTNQGQNSFLVNFFYNTQYKPLNDIQKFMSLKDILSPENLLHILMCMIFAHTSLNQNQQDIIFDRRCIYFDDQNYLLKPYFLPSQNRQTFLVKMITKYKIQLLSPEILRYTLSKQKNINMQQHNIFALALFILEFGLQTKLDGLVKNQQINEIFLFEKLKKFCGKFQNCQLLLILIQNMLILDGNKRKNFNQLIQIVKNYQKSSFNVQKFQETPSFVEFQPINKKSINVDQSQQIEQLFQFT